MTKFYATQKHKYIMKPACAHTISDQSARTTANDSDDESGEEHTPDAAFLDCLALLVTAQDCQFLHNRLQNMIVMQHGWSKEFSIKNKQLQ